MDIKRIVKRYINFKIPTKIGQRRFIIPIIRGTGIRNLQLNNDWFVQLLKRVNLPENTYFIDAGVNIGQTILKFRGYFDNPYLGFELNPNCVRYVRKLIRFNHLKNIAIYPVGLSNKEEVVIMYSNNDIENCCSDSTIVHDLRPNRYQESDKSFASVFSFDHLNLFKSEDRLSMIKIDVEGSELEVVEGMTETIRRHRPLIVCEILDYNSELTATLLQERADKLYHHITQLGYSVYFIRHEATGLVFEKISKIELVLWTPDSLEKNDYLFVPEGQTYIHLNA